MNDGHGGRIQGAGVEGEVGGVLLAAGGGQRFGLPKALIPFEGQLLVERGAGLLRAGGCAPVVVVLGARAGEVRRSARLPAVESVVNHEWRTGMASSLRVGLAALEGRCRAAVVALADQPLIGPEAVRRLVAAYRSGAPAAVATYGGQPRNPVLLDASLWQVAMTAATGDVGARTLFRGRPDLARLVPCDDTGLPVDIDTREDLAALEGRGDRRERQPCN